MWDNLTWSESCDNLHFNDSLPIHISQPDMLFDFIRSIQSQPIGWFPLQTLINKISSFHTPPFRDIWLLQWNLLLEDLVPDLLPTLPSIRSLPKHEFISNNTQSKVINSYSMILPAHNFRCHISWCPWCIMRIIWTPNPRDSHVSNVNIAILIKE